MRLHPKTISPKLNASFLYKRIFRNKTPKIYYTFHHKSSFYALHEAFFIFLRQCTVIVTKLLERKGAKVLCSQLSTTLQQTWRYLQCEILSWEFNSVGWESLSETLGVARTPSYTNDGLPTFSNPSQQCGEKKGGNSPKMRTTIDASQLKQRIPTWIRQICVQLLFFEESHLGQNIWHFCFLRGRFQLAEDIKIRFPPLAPSMNFPFTNFEAWSPIEMVVLRQCMLFSLGGCLYQGPMGAYIDRLQWYYRLKTFSLVSVFFGVIMLPNTPLSMLDFILPSD